MNTDRNVSATLLLLHTISKGVCTLKHIEGSKMSEHKGMERERREFAAAAQFQLCTSPTPEMYG